MRTVVTNTKNITAFPTLSCVFALILLTSGCATAPPYPQHTEVIDGKSLPIDGDWSNPGGLKFRISRGKMYNLNKPESGAKPGSLIGKEIEPIDLGRYGCKVGSFNPHTGILDYGDSELAITGTSSILLSQARNQKTGLDPSEVVLTNIVFYDVTAFNQQLSSLIERIKSTSDSEYLLTILGKRGFHKTEVGETALNALLEYLKRNWEAISWEDYKRNFMAPDGSFLPELLESIARNRGVASNQSFSLRYQTQGNSTSTYFVTSETRDFLVTRSFATDGFRYERRVFAENGLVYEIVRRSGTQATATVTTEVYHMNGAVFRASKVTGL